MSEPTPSIIDAWKEFERNVVPADFGRDQRRTVMFAFYTAAATVADRLLAAQPTEHPMDDYNLECFIVELKVECQELANAIARTFPAA
jgi:hypothetical protein